MGKISFGRVLECLCISSGSSSCFCINSYGTDHHQDDQFERKPLVNPADQLKDIYDGPKTLAFQLKPKVIKIICVCVCIFWIYFLARRWRTYKRGSRILMDFYVAKCIWDALGNFFSSICVHWLNRRYVLEFDYIYIYYL